LFMQVANGLKSLISSGTIVSGERLPSGRGLSSLLSLNRSTVQKAYLELLEHGYARRTGPYTLVADNPERSGVCNPYPSIGVLMPDKFSRLYEMPYVMSYFKGIMDEISNRHLSLMMLTLPDLNASASDIRQFNQMLNQRLLGVIHLGGRPLPVEDRPMCEIFRNTALPQVMVSAFPWFDNVGVVSFDSKSGARSVANQLRALNHRRVGMVLSGSSFTDRGAERGFTYASMSRPREVLEVFQEYNLECDEKLGSFSCVSPQSAFEKLRQKHECGQMPTVFWCCSDEIAYWVLDGLTRLGYNVPGDVSVVGFDGTPPPPDTPDILTTIALPFYDIGKYAVIQLLDIQKNGINEQNKVLKLQSHMIWKKSLGPARE
ncbi:MAG: substrate-binding domain-containing protein, partial [Victivallales bacterium]|nr:substrate-binding domain-containing protein [Victivallales bacterium]